MGIEQRKSQQICGRSVRALDRIDNRSWDCDCGEGNTSLEPVPVIVMLLLFVARCHTYSLSLWRGFGERGVSYEYGQTSLSTSSSLLYECSS